MNNTELAKYQPQVDLVRWQGNSIEAERIAQSIVITCDEEEQMAVDSLSQIKGFKNETEAARKVNVDPFNTLVKRVNDMFRPISQSLDNAESVIKGKIIFFRKEKERIRQGEENKRRLEYQKQVEEEQRKAKETKQEPRIIAPPPAIMQATNTTTGAIGSATSRKFWNYEVVDLHQLYSERPDLVNIEPKRREILSAIDKNQHIAGLKIFEDMNIAGSASR